MAKQPTTLPRWTIFLTHGALVITIIAAAIAFGRAASRTEQALKHTEQVPELKANFEIVTRKLDEISKKQDTAIESQDKRIATLEKQQAEYNLVIQRVGEQINALTSTNGSAWALSQSNAVRLGKVEGMLEAMQRMQFQQMQKEK